VRAGRGLGISKKEQLTEKKTADKCKDRVLHIHFQKQRSTCVNTHMHMLSKQQSNQKIPDGLTNITDTNTITISHSLGGIPGAVCASEDGCQVKPEAINVVLVHPVAQAIQDHLAHLGVCEMILRQACVVLWV
jgi:hypothetical protein